MVQLVAHQILDLGVLGSSPSGAAKVAHYQRLRKNKNLLHSIIKPRACMRNDHASNSYEFAEVKSLLALKSIFERDFRSK